MPTLYLTNAASRKPPYRGPGRVWTIMAAPRPQFGEAGEGRVNALVPRLDDLKALKAGEMSLNLYRNAYFQGLRFWPGSLGPTDLWARLPDPALHSIVQDGDTLICCCSRAEAAEGRCHRVWAAQALLEAGWAVVLDGVRLTSPEAPN